MAALLLDSVTKELPSIFESLEPLAVSCGDTRVPPPASRLSSSIWVSGFSRGQSVRTERYSDGRMRVSLVRESAEGCLGP
jgi:hypothetical protein